MPLAQFVAEAMEVLAGDAGEVAVGNAKFLRAGAGEGAASEPIPTAAYPMFPPRGHQDARPARA
jgi:hypothetical protein